MPSVVRMGGVSGSSRSRLGATLLAPHSRLNTLAAKMRAGSTTKCFDCAENLENLLYLSKTALVHGFYTSVVRMGGACAGRRDALLVSSTEELPSIEPAGSTTELGVCGKFLELPHGLERNVFQSLISQECWSYGRRGCECWAA